MIIFKQTADESNVEQTFSRSGHLSDPNMSVAYLAQLTKVGVNGKAYKPPADAIKGKYYELFRGRGGEGVEIFGTKKAQPHASSQSQPQQSIPTIELDTDDVDDSLTQSQNT